MIIASISSIRRNAAFVFAAALVIVPILPGWSAGEPDFITRPRQITFEGARAGEGYFNREGTKLVLQSEREPGNPFYQIYVLDFESGETRRVSTGAGKTTCAFFSPGSDRILFASTHGDPASAELQRKEIEMRASGQERRYSWDYDEHYDLYEVPVGGGEPRRITDAPGYDAEGSYSPDGKWIAFCSTRAAYPLEKLSAEERKEAGQNISHFGDIYLMPSTGGAARRLTTTPGYDGGPFFTPDGTRIVWRRFDQYGMNADIYSMPFEGGAETRVTDFGSMSWAPWTHPSGDYIIFASNKLGFANFELFIVDSAGTKEPVRVTFTEGFDGLPVFSPDGGRLSWTSQRHGGKGGQIYLADWNDKAARKALEAAPPRVAPDPAASIEAIAKAHEAAGVKIDMTPAPAPAHPAIKSEKAVTEGDLRADIEYLASDRLEGRLTGTEGERLAGEYIAARFERSGLKPLPGGEGFAWKFEYAAGVEADGASGMTTRQIEPNPHIEPAERLKKAGEPRVLRMDGDWRPLAFSDSGTTGGLIAFAGYGLVVPGENGGEPQYDSYGGADVRGRVVIVMRYVPEEIDAEKRQVYNRFAGLRFKALQARERGAAALLVVSGPNSPQAGELVPLDLDIGGATSGLLAASISGATAEKLLSGTGRSLKELQSALDKGVAGRAEMIEDTHLELTVKMRKVTGEGRNIIAMLPGTTDEYTVIGAHYDHLGRGGKGSSLANKNEEGGVHHGADDNASGVAALLEIAEAMAAEPPRRRGVIFAAWSGEEIGLLGSADFCRRPGVPMNQVAAYLNMDMVGRARDNKLMIQGVGSSGDWRRLIEKRNLMAGFALSLADDPYLPTDSTSFYSAGVPTLHFFTGAHEDYHRPSDTAEKINHADTVRIAEFVRTLAGDLASGESRPAYQKAVKAEAPEGGGREMMRAYLGTIPDYATEGIEGVKLSGVRAGGPADKAGLAGGDIIIEFAGRPMKNVYDYTYALDAVKIGEPVTIVVLRGGKRVETSVTPEARK